MLHCTYRYQINLPQADKAKVLKAGFCFYLFLEQNVLLLLWKRSFNKLTPFSAFRLRNFIIHHHLSPVHKRIRLLFCHIYDENYEIVEKHEFAMFLLGITRTPNPIWMTPIWMAPVRKKTPSQKKNPRKNVKVRYKELVWKLISDFLSFFRHRKCGKQ